MKTNIYNPTYFNNNQLWDTRKKLHSFNHYVLKDGMLIGMFQGNRGSRPDLDFIIKFLEPGIKNRLRTPKHIHWVVDLIIKKQSHINEVRAFVHKYLTWYDDMQPFQSIQERNNYIPFTPQIIESSLIKLNVVGTYSSEYLAHIIELFIRCEKTLEGAFMFKGLLQLMIDYCDGKKDYFQVLNHASQV
ncbi:hypothetical protein ACFL0J_08415 [Candidatus Neomarinimicrobiota bacterium]